MIWVLGSETSSSHLVHTYWEFGPCFWSSLSPIGIEQVTCSLPCVITVVGVLAKVLVFSLIGQQYLFSFPCCKVNSCINEITAMWEHMWLWRPGFGKLRQVEINGLLLRRHQRHKKIPSLWPRDEILSLSDTAFDRQVVFSFNLTVCLTFPVWHYSTSSTLCFSCLANKKSWLYFHL